MGDTLTTERQLDARERLCLTQGRPLNVPSDCKRTTPNLSSIIRQLHFPCNSSLEDVFTLLHGGEVEGIRTYPMIVYLMIQTVARLR